jgi:dienelactone hydrolase
MGGTLPLREGGRSARGLADPRAGGLRSGPARVARRLAAQGCRWIAPDLRIHRGSPTRAPFGDGIHAADIACPIADPDPAQVTLMGRSFGGVLATLVAGGLFRALPARLVTPGVKTGWTDDEIGEVRAPADRPSHRFATWAQAREDYLKMAGLSGPVAPEIT